jgi:hypothetical protein
VKISSAFALFYHKKFEFLKIIKS